EEKPYLIILDLAMPEMTGKDLLAKIRNDEKNKDIKVVMLTGQNDARAIAEISSLGVSDYILKPVTLEDLYSKLIRYLN
ncbi:MAG: response regulator, partial [Melioribacteraceae bacterium]